MQVSRGSSKKNADGVLGLTSGGIKTRKRAIVLFIVVSLGVSQLFDLFDGGIGCSVYGF